MAIVLDAASAKMDWTPTGAAAGSKVGDKFALLHCTKNANLGAGDTDPPGDVPAGPAINITASVFLETTAGEKDLGDREFGLVQVAELFTYEYLYAGRVTSEGSCQMNMKAGFTANPSLDVSPSTGQSIDEKIFDNSRRQTTPTTTPRRGFLAKVDFGDHPNNRIPLTFENRVAGAPNFLARASRAQHFIVFFVTRESATAPLVILGRLGWAVNWIVEYSWTAGKSKPTGDVKRADLFPGKFELGSPDPADRFAQIALKRTTPTTNDQDVATSDAVHQRKEPMLMQSKTWPDGFRAGFFQ